MRSETVAHGQRNEIVESPVLVFSRGAQEGDVRSYLSSSLRIILPKEKTLSRMSSMVGSRSVRGGQIFDLFLAATMLDNGVQAIYTENVRDFEGLDGIEAINPLLR